MAAQALDLGLVDTDTVIDTTPFKVGKYTIGDQYNKKNSLTVREVIVKSSNTFRSGRLALMINSQKQRQFLSSIGLDAPTGIEISESAAVNPLWPKRWSKINSVTVAYGHGVAVSQLHLAAAYASLVNGGYAVKASVMKRQGGAGGRPRVISHETSETVRRLLHDVVLEGTARGAIIEGYAIGGKTGTADKPKPTGGYYRDRVISTFASFFPVEDPQYVLVVSLDEPQADDDSKYSRTAGRTAVPSPPRL